ncbi:MAG: hypothetical protein JKY02_05645 [Flavobacteriaceae bacterium]|nr:hypothetical protein [Flavobacteriaceae bacterium]
MRIFKEEQRFTRTWLTAVLTVSILALIGMVIKEYSEENSSMTTAEFLSTVGLILLVITPIFFFKLTTRIDEKGIHYRFFPFHRSLKTILWSDIQSVYIRKYNAISEYGGWGLKGKAINTSGNIGIQLKLTNTKKLLIGTHKEVDAKKVLETYRHKTVHHEN